MVTLQIPKKVNVWALLQDATMVQIYMYLLYKCQVNKTDNVTMSVREMVFELKGIGERSSIYKKTALKYWHKLKTLEKLKLIKNQKLKNKTNITVIDLGMLQTNEKPKKNDTLESVKTVFDHWNALRKAHDLGTHREVTHKMKTALNKLLNKYTLEEVLKSITNYIEISTNPKYWYDHKGFRLENFLKQDNGARAFMDEAKPHKAYINNNKRKGQTTLFDDGKSDWGNM